MATYLDVGVSQVQTWLTRSPDLKGLRGASSMLTTATAKKTWLAQMPAGSRWNDQSGDIAGVVSLIVDEADPRAVAMEVLHRLRAELPMALLQGGWATARTYAEAYPALVTHADVDTSISSLPAAAEFALARTCQRCRQAAASTSFNEVGEPKRTVHVCRECSFRRDEAGHANLRPTAMEELWGQVLHTGSQAAIPLTLEALADVGATGTGAATRVAVFYADGNSVGAFLKKAMKSGITKADIARTIDIATKGAFVEAARSATRGDRIGVIPHLVGGDDVMASVSAACVWDFVLAFIETFDRLMTVEVRGWGEMGREVDGSVDLPTMSAGIVFHHVKSPLNDAIAQAARLLKQAKSSGMGVRICWSDQMNDSPLGPGAAPRSMDWILGQRAAVSTLAAEGQSHRKQIGHLTRTDTTTNRVRLVLERQGTLRATEGLLGDDEAESLADLLWVAQIATDPPTGWAPEGVR